MQNIVLHLFVLVLHIKKYEIQKLLKVLRFLVYNMRFYRNVCNV